MSDQLTPLNPDLERALTSVSFDKGMVGQIESLRKMTEMTGDIYELQLQNLKLWPLVIFPNVARNEVTIDTVKKEIFFEFKLRPRAKTLGKQNNRFVYLDAAVRKLLGKDWLIRVKMGKREVYRGEKYVRPDVDFNAPVPL